MKPSVLILASGGVDSSIAAYLLKKRGHPVTGLFLRMTRTPQEDSALSNARRFFDWLGQRLVVRDVSDRFSGKILNYFEKSYLSGQTPNCCCICNWQIKIRTGLEVAEDLGIPFLATGHYARILRARHTYLLRARHKKKDQSYFLHRIRSYALDRLLFPLGDMEKEEVRKMAKDLGLSGLFHNESQDICFFKGDYREFLKGRSGQYCMPGKIVTTDGKVLGSHKGIWAYTVGQRRGLGLPDKTPYYVVEIRADKNEVVVGKKVQLFKKEMMVKDINWLVAPKMPGTAPCKVKIRSRHEPAEALVQVNTHDLEMARVVFKQPQRAVTPGQFAVFYKGKVVLGGGRICK